MRGETISPEAYEVVKQAWCSSEMCTLFNMLKWYSLLDVRPFLEAVRVYLIQYKERGLDLFKTAISLPGISLNWAFDAIPKGTKFHLFPTKHADMGETMHNNLTSGPNENNQSFT